MIVYYRDRDHCIDREIVGPLEASEHTVTDFDLDGIVSELVETTDTGPDPRYFVDAPDEEFWDCVERHRTRGGCE